MTEYPPLARQLADQPLPSDWHFAGEQPEAADGDGGRSYASAVAHQQSRAARVCTCAMPGRGRCPRHREYTAALEAGQ
jgi:hypothetical protein